MSMINEKLETFNAVCETKSFTKAVADAACGEPTHQKIGRRAKRYAFFAQKRGACTVQRGGNCAVVRQKNDGTKRKNA